MAGGGGASKTTTTSKQELSPEQQKLLGLVMPKAKDYIKTPLELFPGSAIADPSNLQQQGRDQVQQAATGTVQQLSNDAIGTAKELMTTGGSGALQGGQQGILAGAGGLQGLGRQLSEYDKTQSGRDFLASGALLDPASNPVLAAQSEAALRPITKNLQERILPGIRDTAVGGNMFGGSRQGIAEGRAVGDYLTQAGDITTQLQSQNFEKGLGAMLATTQGAREGLSTATGQGLGAGASGTNALGNLAVQSLAQSPNLGKLAFAPGLTLESIGSLQQGENQAKLTEKANRFSTEQMLPFLQAQDVANLAFGIGGGSSVTEAQQQPASASPLATGLGIGQLAMMMMGLGLF